MRDLENVMENSLAHNIILIIEFSNFSHSVPSLNYGFLYFHWKSLQYRICKPIYNLCLGKIVISERFSVLKLYFVKFLVFFLANKRT